MVALAHANMTTENSASDHLGDQVTLSRLSVTAFRNYRSARIDLDGRPVVLTGANGAGKTNLLEAVSFLAPGRGLRRAKISEVDNISGTESGEAWAVSATLQTAFGETIIGTGRDARDDGEASERRLVRIDGSAAKSQSELAEHLALSWLTPQMDRLFSEGSGGRRRFLDRLVYAFDPAHAGRVNAYDHAVRERARLIRDGRRDDYWYRAIEDGIAEKGVAVAAARRDLVARLNLMCAEESGPFPQVELAIEGRVDSALENGSALEAEDMLRQIMEEARHSSHYESPSFDGAHKSDLKARHVAKDMPAGHCSTGEQKALLIAIVLAHARCQAVDRGTAPILLLDEVAAHLDEDRRAALFDELLSLGCQFWVTGTDEDLFRPLGDKAQYFDVVDGHVAAKKT